ncbi:DUF2268 domain-containing protein [Priestia taiwanensis]|uniref:DUF2268 domain-containing protein n=1 Tax=Priestia taiwanensis TaxID=1347902 RepID=A0A917EQ96_9BACI|nr:DUF2268 domain-containing putative Zn-dependent protease [Priestia taiwanensis]MBM7364172.1 uncharacterized protein YjaZ [Priestia taiwanensis]GGE72219.1 hypothetical protein GCM10007140_22680 [Priestia taiwanensis]
MGIIRTDALLLKYYDKPLEVCKKLLRYVPFSDEKEMYTYLRMQGMYEPVDRGKESVKELQHKRLWLQLQDEFLSLRQWLSGPDIPVFIFPLYRLFALERKVNKNGIATRKSIFLFGEPDISIEEWKALLTHEYHHVVRIHALEEKENDTLLDSIVMEGLAEYAVYERYGEEVNADWTKLYTKEEAGMMWKKLMRKHHEVKKHTKQHDFLLNGLGFYPSMLGYNVGYHIVQDAVEHTKATTKELLGKSAQDIMDGAVSFCRMRRRFF